VLRLYWVAAAAVTAHYYRPVALTSLQIVALAMAGAAVRSRSGAWRKWGR
jgi:hypothetical protein